MTRKRTPAHNSLEARVEEHLRNREPTSQILNLFASEEDSQELVWLLCRAVVFNEQPNKVDFDGRMKQLTGYTEKTLKGAPNRIRNFQSWLRKLFLTNFEICADNNSIEYSKQIDDLSKLAEFVDHKQKALISVERGGMWVPVWVLNETLETLATLIEKTPQATYANLELLLSEAATALGMRQAGWKANSIYNKVKNYRKSKVKNRRK